MIISLFLKRWEIWIINLKIEEYGSSLKNINQTQKIIKWYICRDKKDIKKQNTCGNIFLFILK